MQTIVRRITPAQAQDDLWFTVSSQPSLLLPPLVALVSVVVLILRTTALAVQNRSGWKITSLQQLWTRSETVHPTRVANAPITLALAMRLFQLASCITLLILFILKPGEAASRMSWPISYGAIYTCAYTACLSLTSIFAGSSSDGRRCTQHLTFILLTFGATYIFRNVWPLMTFTWQPQDGGEGVFCWLKMVLILLAGVAVPLFIPAVYEPLDSNMLSKPTREQTASLASYWMYSFLDPFIWKAWCTNHLTFEELPPLADYDRASHLTQSSCSYLDTFSGAKRQHMFASLMRVFWREFTSLAILLVANLVFSFAEPFAINRILYYLETDGEGAVVRPWVWISWFFVGPFIHTSTMQAYNFISSRTLVRTEAILTQLIFDHTLRIRLHTSDHSHASSDNDRPTIPIASQPTVPLTQDGADGLNKASTTGPENASLEPSINEQQASSGRSTKTRNLAGKINNLITADLSNVTDGRNFVSLLIFTPLDIVLCTLYLYYFLGYSVFIGLAAMLALTPVPGYLGTLIQKAQTERMEKTDARVQSVSDILSIVRMIKLFGWEGKVEEQLDRKRADELVFVLKRKLINLASSSLNYLLPLVHIITTYSTYTLLMKRPLSPSLVFSTISVFDWLRSELSIVLREFPAIIEAKVSLDRLQAFLFQTELLDKFAKNNDLNLAGSAVFEIGDHEIGMKDSAFTWSAQSQTAWQPFTLQIDGEIRFKRGCINLVIGPTGSGKTSLLMALLGEMHFQPISPHAWVNLPRQDGVAYAAQESWILNDTIRNNILFGSKYNESRYNKVIYQCALDRDLELFHASDATEVGEQGMTLSGGQKARIAMARAIYSLAAIVLLDDTLSALDVHTAKWIVEKCFKGDLMERRTLILATHNVVLASTVAAFTVLLGADGQLKHQGTAASLLEQHRLLIDTSKDYEGIRMGKTRNIDEHIAQVEAGKLVLSEEKAVGHLGWPAIKMFFNSMGGQRSRLFWILTLVFVLVCELSNAGSTWFLGYWASQYQDHDAASVNTPKHLSAYACLLGLGVITRIIWNRLYIQGHLRACQDIHRQLIRSVLRTTFRWLDATPVSRIITRCTQDIRTLDGPLADSLVALLETTTSMMVKLGGVLVVAPAFLAPAALLALSGGGIGQIYMKAQLNVKREMSNAKAPVLGHFGSTMAGIVTVRAFGAEQRFRERLMDLVDRYSRCARPFWGLSSWVGVRLDAIGGLLAAALGAYLVYGQATPSAAEAGFSMTMIFGFSVRIIWSVRFFNEAEIAGNSLERILEYVNLEQEPKAAVTGEPPAYWPTSGELHVQGLSARYSSTSPPALHNISFHLHAGQRVGIVGRTGSGKSTLALSLLQCIPTEGVIVYDGISITSLNLDALRSKITIIPQVPELVSGTIRQNLDPFAEHDDVDLNDALCSAGLFSLQNKDLGHKLGLETPVSGAGQNLSVGQRQILALARAIVRRTKLVILDEATSAIDHETDVLIQSSLRTAFERDVTIITIAHRLQTIMDADKIILLDAGRLVEFDSPSQLLKKSDGLFRALVEESGDREVLSAMTTKDAEDTNHE